MPFNRCKVNGKKGTRWGQRGKCYRGPKGKSKAIRQMRAARANGYVGNVYCPTGKGGGIDPTCTAADKGGDFGGSKKHPKNLSGDSMEAGKSEATHKILAKVRARIRDTGIPTGQFKQIYGTESELGAEYLATGIGRFENLAVSVWRPIGDDAIKEAYETCDEVIVVKRHSTGNPWVVYGITWKGPWPHKKTTNSHQHSYTLNYPWELASNSENCGIGPDGFEHGNTCARGGNRKSLLQKMREGAEVALRYLPLGRHVAEMIHTPAPGVDLGVSSKVNSRISRNIDVKKARLFFRDAGNRLRDAGVGSAPEGVKNKQRSALGVIESVVAEHRWLMKQKKWGQKLPKSNLQNVPARDPRRYRITYILDGEKRPVAASLSYLDPRDNKTMYVGMLGSLVRGGGSTLLKEQLRHGKESWKCEKARLHATSEARGFYRKMGLKDRLSDRLKDFFRFTPDHLEMLKTLADNSRHEATSNARKRIGKFNPLLVDPSRTAGLRRAFIADLNRRFDSLQKELLQILVAQDAFGLSPHKPIIFNDRITLNYGQYAFLTSAEKAKAFLRIVQRLSEKRILEADKAEEDRWWTQYTQRAFKSGAGEAFDLVKKSRWGKKDGDWYKGAREEFLQSGLLRPIDIETVKLMAGRIYTDLKGITEAMSVKLNRTLTDGLVQGKGPYEIAKQIRTDIEGIGKARSRILARTEMVRAKAEGQLVALEKLQVPGVQLKVEWVVSGLGTTRKGFPSPCPKCKQYAGRTFTIEEAKGLLPVHPACSCGWIPSSENFIRNSLRQAVLNACGAGSKGDPGFEEDNTCGGKRKKPNLRRYERFSQLPKYKMGTSGFLMPDGSLLSSEGIEHGDVIENYPELFGIDPNSLPDADDYTPNPLGESEMLDATRKLSLRSGTIVIRQFREKELRGTTSLEFDARLYSPARIVNLILDGKLPESDDYGFDLIGMRGEYYVFATLEDLDYARSWEHLRKLKSRY